MRPYVLGGASGSARAPPFQCILPPASPGHQSSSEGSLMPFLAAEGGVCALGGNAVTFLPPPRLAPPSLAAKSATSCSVQGRGGGGGGTNPTRTGRFAMGRPCYKPVVYGGSGRASCGHCKPHDCLTLAAHESAPRSPPGSPSATPQTAGSRAAGRAAARARRAAAGGRIPCRGAG